MFQNDGNFFSERLDSKITDFLSSSCCKLSEIFKNLREF